MNSITWVGFWIFFISNSWFINFQVLSCSTTVFWLVSCSYAQLINCGVKENRSLQQPLCDRRRQTRAQCGSLCLHVCVGNTRVPVWVCYWQLSPSPWAGEAACCVGRGYTCSGLVQRRYRYTSHLRPALNCRSPSPPLVLGIEPAEIQRHIYLRGIK